MSCSIEQPVSFFGFRRLIAGNQQENQKEECERVSNAVVVGFNPASLVTAGRWALSDIAGLFAASAITSRLRSLLQSKETVERNLPAGNQQSVENNREWLEKQKHFQAIQNLIAQAWYSQTHGYYWVRLPELLSAYAASQGTSLENLLFPSSSADDFLASASGVSFAERNSFPDLLSPADEADVAKTLEVRGYVYALFTQQDIEAEKISDPALFRIAREAEEKKWQMVERIERGLYPTRESLFFAVELVSRLCLLRLAAVIQLGKSDNKFVRRRLETDLLEGRRYQPGIFFEFRKRRVELQLLSWLSNGITYQPGDEDYTYFNVTDRAKLKMAVQQYRRRMAHWREWSQYVYYSERKNIYHFEFRLNRRDLPLDSLAEIERLVKHHMGSPCTGSLPQDSADFLRKVDRYSRFPYQPVYYRKFDDGTIQVVVDRYHWQGIPRIFTSDWLEREPEDPWTVLNSPGYDEWLDEEISYMLSFSSDVQPLDTTQLQKKRLRDLEMELESKSQAKRKVESTFVFYHIPPDWNEEEVETGFTQFLVTEERTEEVPRRSGRNSGE